MVKEIVSGAIPETLEISIVVDDQNGHVVSSANERHCIIGRTPRFPAAIPSDDHMPPDFAAGPVGWNEKNGNSCEQKQLLG